MSHTPPWEGEAAACLEMVAGVGQGSSWLTPQGSSWLTPLVRGAKIPSPMADLKDTFTVASREDA